MTACPACAGPQLVGHPAGVLTIDHTNQCPLRAAEDARAVADADTAGSYGFTRPATDTERVLLDALGLTVTENVDVVVTPLTTGVRNRRFATPTAGKPAPLAPKEAAA